VKKGNISNIPYKIIYVDDRLNQDYIEGRLNLPLRMKYERLLKLYNLVYWKEKRKSIFNLFRKKKKNIISENKKGLMWYIRLYHTKLITMNEDLITEYPRLTIDFKKVPLNIIKERV